MITDPRPTLIAECCQNHNGKKDILKRMIHAAVEAGADYAKIQSIRSRELTRRERFEEGETAPDGSVVTIKRPFEPERARLAGLDLSLDDERWFVEECWRAGIAPMTTVFTRAAVRDVVDLGYEAVKIASYDCRSLPLLRDVRARWSRVIVSTGATTDDEVERAAEVLGTGEYAFLHCVTIYPTPLQALHMRRMAWLRRFTPQVGWSDHTAPARDGLIASRVALALGATVIERHFTVLGPAESRDGPVSVTPALLAELRAFADLPRPERVAQVAREVDLDAALGDAHRELSAEEMRNRDYYAGRFATMIDGQPVYNWDDADLEPPS